MSGQGSDAPSGSGSGLLPTKAIGSLAKKQADVTRQGTQKLKFVPTLPTRRKKEEVKTEPAATAFPAPGSGRGRSRGRGENRGQGRGRGRGAPRPEMEMTASGPFAMGPALAGNNARRSVPRSNFAPVVSSSMSGPPLGTMLTQTAAPSIKKEIGLKGKGKQVGQDNADEEAYSDPDEGVEIVDMEDVRQMDWMAPESLRKEKHHKKVAKEESGDAANINHANALDLSESEEEEELEDIIEHFTTQTNTEPEDPSLREERLYFFQFPAPFPTFSSKATSIPSEPSDPTPASDPVNKKVVFGKDSKDEPGTSGGAQPQSAIYLPPVVDGIIGHLEIYRSGLVKMRLGNGIVLDVIAATQPSFLQQAVHLDMTKKRLSVLGEVNRRFSVSPDVEVLLGAMELADKAPITTLDDEDLIQMNTT